MAKTQFECISPILRVRDLKVSLDYYVRVLGFAKADWMSDDATFGMVKRDGCSLYLCENDQGCAGTWLWIGVEDVEAVDEEYRKSGAKIREGLTNYSWAYELRVEDPDGHVIRFGSDPKSNLPFKDRTS